MAKKERMGVDPLLGIIGEVNELQNTPSQGKSQNIIDGKKIRMVSVSQISPDPKQPRKNIDPDDPKIQELSESIKKHGFINFITVTEVGEKKYIVVAGERRLTAAKIAGLKQIPVMVMAEEKSDVERALIQLEENLQREDLSPFDEAQAYQRLKAEFKLQQKDIVAMIKKPKSYVSQMLGIQKISPEIQENIKSLEVPIAKRVLWDLSGYSEETQQEIWQKIKDEPTIANVEKVAKKLEKKSGKKKQETQENENNVNELWDALKWVVKKDKEMLSLFISSKKQEKLLEMYRKRGQ